MKKLLLPDEYVVVDGGYSGNRHKRPTEGEAVHFNSVARARRETVNRQFKQFYLLGNPVRHNNSILSFRFSDVAILTELLIGNGEPLFAL